MRNPGHVRCDQFIWDIFGHVIAEHVVGTAVTREYVWLGDMPLAVVDAAASPAALYYVHVDHLDRLALMTDASKAVVWRASYEPFGAVRRSPAPRRSTCASPASGSSSKAASHTTGTDRGGVARDG